MAQHQTHSRRVYPLDAHELSEEQIAVAFAMTSRRPEPFDQIAEQVSQEKAADFHERWVLGVRTCFRSRARGGAPGGGKRVPAGLRRAGR